MKRRHLSGGHNEYQIDPEGVCIHYISGRYTKPDDPYNMDEIWRILDEYNFGYHLVIDREGEDWELVPIPLRAWHAGKSEWNGRDDCNSWMLGFALAGMYDEPFTDEQYETLIQVTAEVVMDYEIPQYNIVGHEDVAPERKKDPGPSFDWGRYLGGLAELWS